MLRPIFYNHNQGLRGNVALCPPSGLSTTFKTQMQADGTFAPNNFVITAWATYIYREGLTYFERLPLEAVVA